MEYNQDTEFTERVTLVTGARCRMYLSAGVTKVAAAAATAGVAQGSVCVRDAFSSTVTYGPFSGDYIQPCDLARKRRSRRSRVALLRWNAYRRRVVSRQPKRRTYLTDPFRAKISPPV